MTTPEHDERLHVPLRWWVQATMLVAAVWLVLAVALPAVVAGTATAVTAGLVLALLLGYGSARVRVQDGVFEAGRARIELRHLGAAEPLDKDRTRELIGVEADARAYLLLRPYLSRAVRVHVRDPRDPTPYWLVNTRHPDRLAAALTGVSPSETPVTLDAPNSQED